jgi:hypothetical protein
MPKDFPANYIDQMSKKQGNRIVRLSLPLRSRHQHYMHIIPILPDFAAIVRSFEHTRAAQQKQQK